MKAISNPENKRLYYLADKPCAMRLDNSFVTDTTPDSNDNQ